MAALNFPDTPSLNQTYTANGKTWVWNGLSWTIQSSLGYTGYTGSGTATVIGSSAPATPNNGDLWWNSEDGQLKIYYNDGTSSQWVDSAAGQQGDIGYTGSIGFTGSASTAPGYTGSTGAGYTGSVGNTQVYEAPFTPPTVSLWSTQRTGTGTIADIPNSRGVRFTAPGTSTNTNSLIYAMQAISAGANGWESTLRMRRHTPMVQYAGTGFILRDSVGGKSILLVTGNSGTVSISIQNYLNDTTFALTTEVAAYFNHDVWLRIKELSGTRYYYSSTDGDVWQQLHSEAISASYLTSSTHVGGVYNPNFSGSGSAYVRQTGTVDFLSWQHVGL